MLLLTILLRVFPFTYVLGELSIMAACRVELFSLQGRELSSVWRCNTPDAVTHMLWLGATLLCCGPVGLYAVAVTPTPQFRGKLEEVVRWPRRCRCSLAATGADSAAVFHDQTISYFRCAR